MGVTATACFHPKRRQGEVYVEIINQIHQQSMRMVNEQRLLQNNNDLYQSIKEKVSRKGLIKKLKDNLSSHRNKISEAIHHNYRIVIQSKTIQNHCAGLIIADSIISQTQTYKMNSVKQSNLFPIKTEQSQRQNDSQVSYQIHRFKKGNQEQSMLKQVDMRFQQIYLKMIIYMLDDKTGIYPRILESLNNYCQQRNSKVQFSEEILIILSKIAKYIDNRVLMAKNTYTYYMLLSHLKQNSKDQLKEQFKQLKKFIILWLSTQKNDEIKVNLYEIIKIYVKRSMGRWQSRSIIYQVIIDICDYNKFQNNQIRNLEDAILQFVRGQDLEKQFLKGLILYLFAYSSFSQDQNLIVRWNSISWQVSAEQLKQKYPNILHKTTKLNTLKSISRFISNHNFDINQIITFNRCSFVYVYAFNLYNFSKDPILTQTIQYQLLQSVKQMNNQSIHALIQILYEEIKWDQSFQNYQSTMIRLIRILLNDKQVLNCQQAETKYFISLQKWYPQTIKLQLIQLMEYLITNLTKVKIQLQKQQICEFLYSLYKYLQTTTNQIFTKYKYYCYCTSFLKSIYSRNMVSLLLAYLQNIYTLYYSIEELQSKFFVIAHIYDIHQILAKQKKNPQKLTQIKQKISCQQNLIMVKDQILLYMRDNDKIPNILPMKSILKFNQNQYEINCQVFDRYFHLENQKQQADSNYDFKAGQSYAKNGSTNQNGDEGSDNQSFFDIVERIKI